MVEDVVDGVVVGEGGVDEREGRTRDTEEAGEAGAARGFAEVLSGDGKLSASGDGPKRKAAREQRVHAQDESNVERELAE